MHFNYRWYNNRILKFLNGKMFKIFKLKKKIKLKIKKMKNMIIKMRIKYFSFNKVKRNQNITQKN